MAKDPAFLFYSKDWLEGTMELTAEEKGVYIDLLAHQHQKGTLPSETKRLCKLVGLSEADFIQIWCGIKQKFKAAEDDRLHNLKLTGVVTERLEIGKKNRIIGCLGVAIRQSKKPQELKDLAKKGFKVDDFLPFASTEVQKMVTDWFSERLTVLEIGTANGDANNNSIREGELLYNAEDALLKKAIWLEQLFASRSKNLKDGKEALRKYHLYLTEKNKYPVTHKQIEAGFEKWLMNEKNFTRNGQQGTSTVGKTMEFDDN